MIQVRSRVEVLGTLEAEAVIERLDAAPGIWMGCDVAAEGLYRRESVACTRACLRFCLEGADLVVTPLSDQGAALVERLAQLRVVGARGTDVARVLKGFLAAFSPSAPELALYGALAFDYYRIGQEAPLPRDARRRLVLYFPEEVVVSDASGARRITYQFDLPARALEVGRARISPVSIQADVDELRAGEHARRVDAGIDRLRRGELYSLVLSQTFRRRVAVPASRAFAALRRRNPYPAMFLCNLGGGEMLFGASPDVQLRADSNQVESAPVCGTLRRGTDPLEDADQALSLLSSDKEGAAIALCTDSALAEHAAVCEPGTVEVLSHRRAYFFSTIVHAISHLRGRRRAGLDAVDLILAHSTPATVTGLPKPAARRTIEDLEAEWRGWYAGAVVRLGSDGSVLAHTVLRAARMAGGVAEVRTGGNILVDSDAKEEEEESRLKALTLFRVLEARAEPFASPAEPGTSGRNASRAIRGPFGADAFAAGLRDALAKVGAVPGAGPGVAILSGVPLPGEAPQPPVLGIGEGGLWLLEQDGAAMEVRLAPAFARRVRGHSNPGGFLEGLGILEVGRYDNRGVHSGGLPAGWLESAVSDDGWLLAAEKVDGSSVVLLFRPESVLSGRRDAGLAALSAALGRLGRAMFIPSRECSG